MEGEERAHILVVPYPAQGHINPMLQFTKRLVSKGLKVTLALTIFHSKSMKPNTGTFGVATFSDGYDEYGYPGAPSVEAYLHSLKTVGSRTLTELIKKLETDGDKISCVVYDGFSSWVLDVAKDFDVKGAVFFTQSCVVNTVYYLVQSGSVPVPVPAGSVVSIPGVLSLEIPDVSSFISVYGSYPAFFSLVLDQFSNIDQADWVFCNTFYELEPEVVDWMSKLWPVKTIGPTLPSMYLDARLEGDTDYDLHLFEPGRDKCINWMNTKPTQSVVYVSFGSMAELSIEQMQELAWGLRESNNNFLWVVRETEKDKLPNKFVEETSEKGLVVAWCPQLEVLSHRAMGCFVTHCGWNSTLEAVSLGVPMVALPQWTDQPTNAKFLEEKWKMGLKVRVDEKGIGRRTAISACITEIMEGKKGQEIKKRAGKWKQLAKEAVDKGGSSDKNIEEFVDRLAKHVQ